MPSREITAEINEGEKDVRQISRIEGEKKRKERRKTFGSPQTNKARCIFLIILILYLLNFVSFLSIENILDNGFVMN